MRIHVIAVAYQRPIQLQILIGSFIVQTNPNWILHIIYDGVAPKEVLNVVEPFLIGIHKDNRVHFYESPERYENYGHPNRKTMLETIQTESNDFILMTNDDNYYVPVFIEYMIKAIDKHIGIVMCNTVHSHAQYDVHNSQLYENGIDMGAFIVKANIAKETGFNHIHFSADGIYAEECHRTCVRYRMKVVKINKPLFIHN